jgi:hypothetical protein
MKSTVIRTAIVSSVITAVLVSALGLWAVPKLMNPQTAHAEDSVMQPAVYNGPAAQARDNDRPVLNGGPRAPRPSAAIYDRQPTYARDTVVRDASGEPIRRHRTTEQSALIVAGSAGTGAAIGALAGGGKGAAIGAISGGAAGFIYDRLTANK